MLKRLKLQNLALIEIIEINFEKGLNVFTGESGSGKSLILDSLNSLFGGTNIPLNHLIRPGKEECFIEATFNISTFVKNWLHNNNFDISNNQIIIMRNSFKKGSKVISKYKINNKIVKKSFLENLGYFLIDFAGQNDKYLFNSQDYLRNIIDELASEDFKELSNDIKKSFFKLEKLKKDITLNQLAVQKNKDDYFANTQILQILEEANLDSHDEIVKLKSKQLKLSNNYELKNTLNLVLMYLNDFDSDNKSVYSLMRESLKQLNRIVKYDQTLNELSEQLINAESAIEGVVFKISQYLESIHNLDDNLDEVQARLFKLQNLEKTFSLELPSLINKRDNLRKIPTLDSRHEEISILKEEYSKLDTIFKKKLYVQSNERKKIASRLEKLVTSSLKQLGLSNAAFSIQFKEIQPNSNGLDSIQFLFSANPDQKLSPINKVISGGEMSRFLLALKFNMLNVSNSLFLDEIDNGLSGQALQSTINLIKKISLNQQTLCITHHPHLAASANVHFKVKKNINNGLTSTSLIKLTTRKQKQKELTDLIGGEFEEASNYALTLMNHTAA